MNLFIVSNDLELKKEFQNTGFFNEIVLSKELNIAAKEYDVVLISDRILNINELSIKNLDLKGKVYYLISNTANKNMINNINMICSAKNIDIIPPKMSVKNIVDFLLKELFSKTYNNSNVITFFGADSKVGTTMISQCVAQNLAEKTNSKVFLMFLNGNRSTSYIEDNASIGIDNIKVKLLNQILTKEELMENCIVTDNLYILPGVNEMLDIRQYKIEVIEYLITIAAQLCNLVVIDAGNANTLDFCGNFSIAALNSAKYKYFITTQNVCSYDSFIRANEQVLEPLQINKEDFFIIINKYLKSAGLPTVENLSDKYNMIYITDLPFLDFKGWECEFEKTTLLSNINFKVNIEQISKLICSQFNIVFKESKVNNNLFKKLFSKL